MSRTEDIIDLIRVANEIYLLNPSQNIRSAYIQIDDICELAMKSYLENSISNWSDTNSDGRYKTFNAISDEVASCFERRNHFPELISRIKARRDNRNHFFHNQRQTALTVSEKHCLDAYIDLYELMYCLFSQEYTNIFKANTIYKTQVTLIKLKYKALEGGIAWRILNDYIISKSSPPIKSMPNTLAFDILGIFGGHISYDEIKYYLGNLIKQNNIRLEQLNKQTSSDKKSIQSRQHQKNQIENDNEKIKGLLDFCIGN